jgi:hypothetical protein
VKLVGFILIRDLEKLKQAYKNTYKSDIPKEYLEILTKMYEEQTRLFSNLSEEDKEKLFQAYEAALKNEAS